MTINLYAAACAYVEAGLSVIPVKGDGSKAPALNQWKEYQSRRPTPDELRDWFDGRTDIGVAVVCGAVSGNLTVIDFDDAATFELWSAAVEKERPGLLGTLPLARTPGGGAHVYVRGEKVVGSRKVASDPARPTKPTLVETKGCGGYVLAPGSSPACHPTGGVYTWVRSPLNDEAV